MFALSGLLATVVLSATAATTGLSPAPSAVTPLRGDLAEIVRAAAVDELIPISIVMRDQAPRSQMDQLNRIAGKQQRREAAIARLKALAQASNGDLLATLQAEQARGAVGKRLRALWIHNVIATEATAQVILQLAGREDIAYINYDRPVGEEVLCGNRLTDVIPKGEGPLGGRDMDWGVSLMRAPEVWSDLGITGQGAVVGIIDTGGCIAHPDLTNQIWNNEDEIPGNNIDDDNNGYIDDIIGWNFRDDNNQPGDTNGHGTHTGGTVVGDGTNGTITGMAPDAALMVLKFWNNFGGESIVWEAMQYAVDNDAHIITASIGWPHSQGPDRATWRAVCENAIAAGVAVIYAAGNESYTPPPDSIRTPGDVPDMITIGATDPNDNIASFSSIGPVTWQNVPPYNDWPYPPGKIKPSVSAPGVDTKSTSISSGCQAYQLMSGTSMATPHVAGAAALMIQANPNLDHFGVKTALMESSIDLGAPGMDNTFGAGRVDAYEAVLYVMDDCPADFDGDGDVDTEDLLTLLAAWGTAGPDGDVDGDGDVDTADLLALLAAWGDCP